MRNLFRSLKSFDFVIIIYCLITGIYISIGYNQLHDISFHLLIRVAFLSIVFLLVYIEKWQNKILLFIRNFYPLIFIGFFYSETDYYNNLIFENFDPILVRLEEFLFGSQLAIEFPKLIPFQWFSEIMHFGYFSYYLMIVGIPLLFYIKSSKEFEKSMFIILTSFCLYYLVFIVFPSIGPQFYFTIDQLSVPDGYIFDKIMHIIVELVETETGAFPSSHVGIVIIFLILIWKHFRNYFKVLILLSIFLILSTVYIKAHYAIDILAGIISGILFFLLSNWIFNSVFIQKKQLK